jgi:two-component system, OmpR family, response regulator
VLNTRDFLWWEAAADVAVLRWPEQRDERDRLQRLNLPRLLLLSADLPAPDATDCLEDWIRLPALDEDVHARLNALRDHAIRHPPNPTIDVSGQLEYRGKSEFLSPTDHAIAEVLVERFGTLVSEEQLLFRAWPDGDGTPTSLRVHVHRLRKRLAPLGLAITSVRGRGYIMSEKREQQSTETVAS